SGRQAVLSNRPRAAPETLVPRARSLTSLTGSKRRSDLPMTVVVVVVVVAVVVVSVSLVMRIVIVVIPAAIPMLAVVASGPVVRTVIPLRLDVAAAVDAQRAVAIPRSGDVTVADGAAAVVDKGPVDDAEFGLDRERVHRPPDSDRLIKYASHVVGLVVA